MLGLRCCADFSLVAEWGPLFIAAQSLLIVVASPVAKQRLRGAGALGVVACGFISCGAQVLVLHGMWDLPRPGIKPMSPALAGRFFSMEPRKKPWSILLFVYCPSMYLFW